MGCETDLDIEEALDAAGSWGLYQKLIFFLILVAGVPNSFIALHFVFSQSEPDHHCTYPEEFLNFTRNSATETADIISTIIPMEENQHHQLVQSQCKMYKRNYSDYPPEQWPKVFGINNATEKINCVNGMTYAFTADQETVAMEFSMVCDDDWKAPLAVSMYHMGMTIGSFMGVTADWYGRRPIFIVACLVQVISQIFGAASWSFVSYCASICLTGVCGLMNFVIAFVLVTEITDHKWRNFMCISSAYSFAVGYFIIALVGYYFQQWRWFIGVLAIVSSVLYAPCCWFFPESPRWLAQKGRSDDAIKLLKTIAKVNKRTDILDNALQAADNRIISKNNITSTGIIETIRVLFKSGIVLRYATAVYGWVVSALIYYAISIYSSDFSDDRFINLLLAGVAEIPALVIGYILVRYIGRPRTALLLMLFCAISSILLPFIPEDLSQISTFLAILGKGSVAAVFYCWYLISSEVVPTLQRSSAMSLCSATARVGSFSAPYMMYLRKYNYLIPNMFMAAVALSNGLLAILFIPETFGVDVPDTVEEAKQNNSLCYDGLGWVSLEEAIRTMIQLLKNQKNMIAKRIFEKDASSARVSYHMILQKKSLQKISEWSEERECRQEKWRQARRENFDAMSSFWNERILTELKVLYCFICAVL